MGIFINHPNICSAWCSVPQIFHDMYEHYRVLGHDVCHIFRVFRLTPLLVRLSWGTPTVHIHILGDHWARCHSSCPCFLEPIVWSCQHFWWNKLGNSLRDPIICWGSYFIATSIAALRWSAGPPIRLSVSDWFPVSENRLQEILHNLYHLNVCHHYGPRFAGHVTLVTRWHPYFLSC